jgi:hypothetical protein
MNKHFMKSMFEAALADDESARVSLFALTPDKPGRPAGKAHCATVEEIEAFAAKHDGKHHLYFRVGIVRGDQPAKGRSKEDGTVGIPGLWADIDIAGPEHNSKKKYPPSQEIALRLLQKVGPRPSYVIDSGFGIHAYWLFREPWIFESAEERAAAATLERRWELTVRAALATEGYTCDSVHDLARIMRIPGTKNMKSDPPEPSRVVAGYEERAYNPDDFEDFLIDEQAALSPEMVAASVEVGHLCLLPDANPPADKFTALSAASEMFEKTWANARNGEMTDNSPSAYDMSLANQAVAANWSDQEVADLLIAFRRVNRLPAKMRLDYIQNTIAKARLSSVGQKALENLTGEGAAPPPLDPSPQDRQRLMQAISAVLEVPAEEWRQRGVENATYVCVVALPGRDVRIHFPSSEFLLSQAKFRARVMEATRCIVRPMKADRWLKLMKQIMAVVEVEEIAESERVGETQGWLADFASSAQECGEDEWKDLLSAGEPFIMDGLLHITADALKKHLRFIADERLSKADVISRLKDLGFKSVVKSFRAESGKNTSRSVWVAQEGVVG